MCVLDVYPFNLIVSPRGCRKSVFGQRAEHFEAHCGCGVQEALQNLPISHGYLLHILGWIVFCGGGKKAAARVRVPVV